MRPKKRGSAMLGQGDRTAARIGRHEPVADELVEAGREVRGGRADLVGPVRERDVGLGCYSGEQTGGGRANAGQACLGGTAAIERHPVLAMGEDSEATFEFLRRSPLGRHAVRLAGIGGGHRLPQRDLRQQPGD
jgi:hypothetical protein